MVDFDRSRKDAFEYINLTESAQKLSKEAIHRLKAKEKTESKLLVYVEVWELTSELYRNGSFEAIKLYIGFPREFPLVLPKVYLSCEDRERLSYLPHLDEDGQVCIYDDEEVYVDWKHGGQIVKECVIKARNVLEQGLNGSNSSDFEDEFTAYWEQKYNKGDKIRTELSMLIDDELPDTGSLKVLSITTGFEGYNFIVHNDSEEFGRVRQYLLDAHYKLVDGNAMFLGVAKNTLPYNETYSSAYNFVKDQFSEFESDFQRYISKGVGPLIILFARAVKGRYIFYGWQIGPFTLERPGFRKKTLTPWYVFSNLDEQRQVVRLKFDIFTTKRLSLRTNGLFSHDMPKRISIVGLGSIGSNILQYFISMPLRKLDLIDPDILTIDNINRHLLGLNYIKRYKVNALEEYLRSANPILNVKGHPASIVSFLCDNSDVLMDSDLVVVCIGKTNIEEFIVSKLIELGATNAIAIIWVEPYLVGAHCLYLRPTEKIKFGDLFDDGIFKFNIIASSEYINPQKTMLLKEGGCQTTYLPYGHQSITRFLTCLTPHLFDLMDNPNLSDCLLSFKGSETVIRQSGVQLSQIGSGLSNNTIIKIELNDDSNWRIQD